MKKNINWKIFIILIVSSLASIACVFPYIVTVQGELLKMSGVSLVYIFLVQIIQSAVLFSIAIFIGLFLSEKTGFQLPLLTAIVNKNSPKKIIKNIVGASLFWGAVSGILIYAADFLFVIPGISTHQTIAPVWQTLLASFYGGITEEILMRLFLMTLFVWLGMKIFKQKKPSNVIVIFSIILAAAIFGLGHLPITASLTKITPLVVMRAIILNGIGGIIFGYLYWKKGLESAIISHFATDIFLLTLLPLLIKCLHPTNEGFL